MTSSAARARKYDAKVHGDVSKARLDHYHGVQAGAFTSALRGQVHIERLVKSIISRNSIMVSLNHFYMNFGKKIDKIRRTYMGPTAQLEVCIEFEKWLTRGLDSGTLDEIVVALGFENCAAAPAVCAWDWKRKLTFTGNVSATDLDDFPVLVHLTVANFDFNKAHAQGHDIRFMDSDTCPSDGTPLKHEIELWDKAGNNAWVWVKVPRIDGGSVIDFIYMFYGNVGVPDGQDAVNVWNANFSGVWHMRGDGTATLPKSTTPNLDMTKRAIGNPANASPNIDGYQVFNGTTGYASVVTNADLDIMPTFTMQMWIRTSDTLAILMERADGGAPRLGYIWGIGILGPNEQNFYNGAGWVADNGNIVSDGNWHLVCVTGYPNFLRWYTDGVFKGQDVLASPANRAQPMVVGAGQPLAGPNIPYAGDMDEVRQMSTNVSDDWVMADFKSQDETLITYGAEQPT